MAKFIKYDEALKNYKSSKVKTKEPEDSGISTEDLLHKYHPDYNEANFEKLKLGVNAGDRCHKEVAKLLQSYPLIDDARIAGANVFDTDVLVIGGGGAGCAAAITARDNGSRVVLATKLRLGDSNTVMAEGGIQASIEKRDTPQKHFDDTVKGGHGAGNKDLIAQMVMDAPDVIKWLIRQGMQFDQNEFGDLLTRKAGGTTQPRVVYCSDYTGLEMMRVLRESVLNRRVRVMEYHPSVELLMNENGECGGAVLYDLTLEKYMIVKANSVILATGGIGRTYLNDFPTSNHFGATGDGLVMSYRLGAKLTGLDSFQFHPTGMGHPLALRGYLITEGVRSAGAKILNGLGKRFVDELSARDVVSAAILKECEEGRGVEAEGGNLGVWLDTPGLEKETPGILKKRFPKLIHLGSRVNIDARKEPMMIYPTLHYQNGGVLIDEKGATSIKGLYCVGEVSGGIHGRNRLMGNALLEIIAFGRRAGDVVSRNPLGIAKHAKVNIDHLRDFRRELSNKKMPRTEKSPMLFPYEANYTFKKKAKN